MMSRDVIFHLEQGSSRPNGTVHQQLPWYFGGDVVRNTGIMFKVQASCR